MTMKLYNRNYKDHYRVKVVFKKTILKTFIMVKSYFNRDHVWFHDDSS